MVCRGSTYLRWSKSLNNKNWYIRQLASHIIDGDYEYLLMFIEVVYIFRNKLEFCSIFLLSSELYNIKALNKTKFNIKFHIEVIKFLLKHSHTSIQIWTPLLEWPMLQWCPHWHRDHLSVILQVHLVHSGFVIGKGGSTVKKIGKDTRTFFVPAWRFFERHALVSHHGWCWGDVDRLITGFDQPTRQSVGCLAWLVLRC